MKYRSTDMCIPKIYVCITSRSLHKLASLSLNVQRMRTSKIYIRQTQPDLIHTVFTLLFTLCQHADMLLAVTVVSYQHSCLDLGSNTLVNFETTERRKQTLAARGLLTGVR